MTQFLQQLIGIFFSVAAISAAMVWFAKRVIELFFSRKVEQFKNDLEKEAHIYKVRYEKMHAERSEVIKNVYTKMVKMHRSFGSLMSLAEFVGEPTKAEKAKIAADYANDFTEYYEQNRIFFDEKLANKIDNMSKLLRSTWIKFQTSQMENVGDFKGKYWVEAWDIIDKEVPKFKKDIEKDFRQIFGVDEVK